MNGRLPAGQQNMQQDMGRRRPYNQNHQQYQPSGSMYNGYVHPYHANNNYYPPPQYQQHQQQFLPPYHNAVNQYPQGLYQVPPPHVRSPPPMQHYGQPSLPPHQYPRPQPSPAIPLPYQQPPQPHTPPSTHSSQAVTASLSPPTPHTSLAVAASPTSVPPFRAPLPWLSRPEIPWPARQVRRKKKHAPQLSAEPVELPTIQQALSTDNQEPVELETPVHRPETPSTSHPPSDQAESTNPTTPSSVQHPSIPAAGETTPVASKATRSAKPAVPIIPAIPKSVSKDGLKPTPEKVSEASQSTEAPTAASEHGEAQDSAAHTEVTEEELKPAPSAPKAWSTPKSWTGLFNPTSSTTSITNTDGHVSDASNFGKSNEESLAEALTSFNATSSDSKVTFLEPRGLVNTGNMCYMNSVLQVLVFCAPFYNFLDQVGKRAVHSFKSDTPLIDAMIMFMSEFKSIDSATSVEKLRLRLKEGELEQYGEAFTPDFVYDVMKRLPRFVNMQRGHQQDAEEFLGFLLDGLHEECVHIMRANASNGTSAMATPNNGPASPISDVASLVGSATGKENGWLEVGPKQKSAVTRSSGTIVTGSPLTKIFGGNLRSELRVPGLKNSVTLEPYQPLQLDIGAAEVHNIVDALKGLTRSETLYGDFKSPKGPAVAAHKQVFIESLPPVLILHLKRFQYDNAGGTQKIWKKVGYPLELEIPKEVFPQHKRSGYSLGGLPKYRLIAVVYHHGKNASGGHYTVDVRRQDGREWIRLDDTVIRRVRSDDVAEGGSEEDPKVLAAALEAQKKKEKPPGNAFSAIDGEDEEAEEGGWKQANGPGKKWSSVVNGTSTPKKVDKFSVKDNKVAYLLFYQRI